MPDNLFATETPENLTNTNYKLNEEAELLNGRLAMIGLVAALGAYLVTGDIIPGIF